MQTEIYVFFLTCFLFPSSSPPPIFTSSLENDWQISQQRTDKPEDGSFHCFRGLLSLIENLRNQGNCFHSRDSNLRRKTE